MKRAMVLVLLFLVVFSSFGWAANVPFRQRAVSPDGKWIAKIGHKEIAGVETSDWCLVLTCKQSHKTSTFSIQSQSAIVDIKWDDAWGIYDFAWSPDSRMILFVFRPYSSNGIGHSNDCFGIFDIKTKQYEWLAGPVVDKMQSDCYGRPNFKLKWLNNNTVSFYMFKTTLQQLVGQSYKTIKVKPAGIRTVSVIKVRQDFARQEQQVRALAQKIIAAMRSSRWRTLIKPLFADPEKAGELIERLADGQKEWAKTQDVEFIWFNRRFKSFGIWVSACLIIKNNKIVDIPMDFD